MNKSAGASGGTGRRRAVAAGLAAGLAVAGGGAVYAWRHGGPDVRGLADYPRGGPQAPRTGAWFGAYVEPRDGDHTQQGLINAVTDYDRRIGGPLDLVRTYYPWNKEFPRDVDRRFAGEGRVVMIGWGGTKTGSIIDGDQDDVIRARARGLKALGKPVLLAWRGEMDRPNLASEVGGPKKYIAAWKRIRAIFHDEGADNVGWVWCPTAEGFDNGRAPAYYPGDGQVDWLCSDGYAYPTLTEPAKIFGAWLAWAGKHDKPAVIGEYGAEENGGARVGWLQSFGTYIQQNAQVKAVAYYDKDHQHNASTVMRYSLRGHPASMKAFRDLAHTPYFDPDQRRRRG
ncbi:Endoglucanase H precursor [Actinomadura rubteroloni]|uniref:Endoglucanase H n=1 Tax=Actinomadura rubteroloni TaxID=1926885 RepID=A0A2P4UQ03_9ACTN|nr:hypothetical protein [Actinomadura rubteroloni]POM27128.1 Endoglucanase H precursor [Actinomadura rubteroloni]